MRTPAFNIANTLPAASNKRGAGLLWIAHYAGFASPSYYPPLG